jgi:hypothetical protein
VPLANSVRRVQRRDRRGAVRRRRQSFSSFGCPFLNAARRVVEQVGDLGNLVAEVCLSFGNDQSLAERQLAISYVRWGFFFSLSRRRNPPSSCRGPVGAW